MINLILYDDNDSKRKIEDTSVDESPEKRLCLEVNNEAKFSNYISNNNDLKDNETVNYELNNDVIAVNPEISSLKINKAQVLLHTESENSKITNADLNQELQQNNGDDDDFNHHLNDNSAYDECEEQNSIVNLNNNQVSPINTSSMPREKCKYGDQCYRKNLEHKAKLSHPGDTDYDLPDNRPECQYGTKCYRKNPQHKLDYKHTQNKRKRTQIRSSSPVDFSDSEEYEESVDESDYDPSFIDDESLDEFESDFEDKNEL